MKKAILVLIGLAIVGGIVWQVAQQMTSANRGGPRRWGKAATAVEIQPVQKKEIKDFGHFTGTLLPKSKFIVAPKVGGRLEKVFVNIGDRIRNDQVIAEIENDEYRQQVDQARAELHVAEANLEESLSAMNMAGRELDRVKALREKKIASESELDNAAARFKGQEAKYKVALAQVDQKKAALKAAEVRLAYTRIRNPFSETNEKWVVGERFLDEGAMLAPNSPIVSILDIASLTAVIHVIERDYPKIRINQPAVITTDAYPDHIFQGKIVRLAPELKETSREARVEVNVPNTDELLKPGMFVRVQIEFATHPDAVVIPLGAVVKRNDRQGIFLADPKANIARFVPVMLGIINGNQVEVLDPPLEGSIITLGQHLLEDGGAIILPSAAPGPAGTPPTRRRPGNSPS